MKKSFRLLLITTFVLLAFSGCKFWAEDEIAEPSTEDAKEEALGDLEEKVGKLKDEKENKVEEKVEEIEEEVIEEEVVEEEVVEEEVVEEEVVEEEKPEKVVEDYDGPSSISLTSPNDGAGYYQYDDGTHVIFKGKISPDTEKISIKATGNGYTDNYTLKNFEQGDASFEYGVKDEWGNLAVGENNYEFTAHFANGDSQTVTRKIYVVDGALANVTINKPKSGTVVHSGDLPVVYEGQVPSYTVKVVAQAWQDGKWDDVYELQDFKHGDTSFTYRAKPEWGNMKPGLNKYQFTAHFSSSSGGKVGGSTVSGVTEISYIDDAGGDPGVVTFDACGKKSKYAGKSWYNTFVSAVAGQTDFGSYGGNEILEVCYAEGSNLAIALVGGEYGNKGQIFKYDTANGVATEASYADNMDGPLSMMEFGKRSGNIIPVTGGLGDAGAVINAYFNYNFVANHVTLEKSYHWTIDGGEENGEWTYY